MKINNKTNALFAFWVSILFGLFFSTNFIKLYKKQEISEPIKIKIVSKEYRAFIEAKELDPFRDKWVVHNDKDMLETKYRISCYDNNGAYFTDSNLRISYERMFRDFLFEDGSRCGVIK